MERFLGVWDIVGGGISLIGGPLLAHWLYTQLPSKKLKVLLDLHNDTNMFFLSCVEQGLIGEPIATEFRNQLAKLNERTEDARLEAHMAKTLYEDFRNMVTGLSLLIGRICKDVREVRSDISATSFNERMHREAQRHAAEVAATDTAHASDGAPSQAAGTTPPLSAEAGGCAALPPADSSLAGDATRCARMGSAHECGESTAVQQPHSVRGDTTHHASEQNCAPLSPSAVHTAFRSLTESSRSINTRSCATIGNVRPAMRWRQNTPLSRARSLVLARVMRRIRVRKEHLRDRNDDQESFGLTGLSSIPLVGDESDEEWEDEAEEPPAPSAQPLAA